MKKNKKILLFTILAGLIVTLFTGFNYLHTNQVAKKEVAQKKRDIQEIKEDYNRVKDLTESGQKKNSSLKQEIKSVEAQTKKFESEANNHIENYLVKREDLNALRNEMVEELSRLPLPSGKVVIQENGKYKIVKKEDDPAYKRAQGIAQKIQSQNVEGIYQSLRTRGLPFEDNDWPSKAGGFAIGTKEYDIYMETNFSLQNPTGAFAAAKDGEAAAYLKRIEDERKKEEEKRKEEAKKKAEEEKKKAEEEKKKKAEKARKDAMDSQINAIKKK